MDYEDKCCPIRDIDGHIESGKQFDLDIVLPEDNRGVVFGIVRDCYKEPVKDAVVKLIEVDCDCGKEERKPVTHTFTDKEGEFVLGPLCPDKKYELQIFVDRVKHVKVCSKCHREGKCLKGVDLKKCDCFVGKKEDFEKCKEHCHDKKDDYEEYKEDDYNKCKEHEYDKKDECKCKEHDYDKKDECKDKEYDCEKKEEHDKCKECECPKKNNWGKCY